METDQSEIAEFARRLAFTALIGNGDMHVKNWSLLYRDRVTPELAPAYDFVSTVPYIHDDSLALSMAGTKRWADISLDLLSKFSARAGLPERVVVEAARETAQRFMNAWHDAEVVDVLPGWLRKRISDHVQSIPLSRQT